MQEFGDANGSLPIGSELWHVHPEAYSPNSFNPQSRARFAAYNAVPPRAMFYASSSSDAALWETLLRDVVPHAASPRGTVLPPLAGWRIARLRLKREASFLDLNPLPLRTAIFDSARRDRINLLTRTPKYAATHRETEKLLAEFPGVGGLHWISRQTGTDSVYVLYAPPLAASDFEMLESVALDSRNGLHFIDQALARAGMHRLDAAGLAQELATQLPEEDDEVAGRAE